MGRFSAMASDVVVVTDDNPADEDPAMIRRAVVAGTRGSSAHVFEVAGRAEAIHHAVDLAEAGDLLVIVGKGDERHQITAHGIVPHSDPDEVEWPSRASGPARPERGAAAGPQAGQVISGFGPERSNECCDIGAPHSGHARSARTGSG
jgi:hypothetical protein